MATISLICTAIAAAQETMQGLQFVSEKMAASRTWREKRRQKKYEVLWHSFEMFPRCDGLNFRKYGQAIYFEVFFHVINLHCQKERKAEMVVQLGNLKEISPTPIPYHKAPIRQIKFEEEITEGVLKTLQDILVKKDFVEMKLGVKWQIGRVELEKWFSFYVYGNPKVAIC